MAAANYGGTRAPELETVLQIQVGVRAGESSAARASCHWAERGGAHVLSAARASHTVTVIREGEGYLVQPARAPTRPSGGGRQ